MRWIIEEVETEERIFIRGKVLCFDGTPIFLMDIEIELLEGESFENARERTINDAKEILGVTEESEKNFS